MINRITHYLLGGVAVAGLTVGMVSPGHADFLPNVNNLNFIDYSGVAPKNSFTAVNPTGWTGGNGLIFIDAPGTDTSGVGGFGIFGGVGPSPVGGNFVQADGNPVYESGFSQTITGLTPGTTYTLSFYQAAGQDGTDCCYSGATTEQWVVSLGTDPIVGSTSGGPLDPIFGPTGSYSNADPNASIALSQDMSTPSQGTTPWQYVSVQLKADATTDLLSFLAWGDNGSTVNLPPIVFLSGVNSVDVLPVPEPATLSILGLGIAGLAANRWRRRNKSA